MTRESLRAGKKKVGRPKAFVFQYKAPTKAFSLKLNFRKSDVPKDEVISALEAIISRSPRRRLIPADRVATGQPLGGRLRPRSCTVRRSSEPGW